MGLVGLGTLMILLGVAFVLFFNILIGVLTAIVGFAIFAMGANKID